MASKCKCGIPAKILKSWTHENPGRRFFACKFSDIHSGRKGCGFFGWFDKNQEGWQRDCINELVLEKRLLSHEVAFLKSELGKVQDDLLMNRKVVNTRAKKAPKNGFIRGIIVGVLATLLFCFIVRFM